MSLRIAPPTTHSTTHTHLQPSLSAPSAPGLHDTLRSGLGPSIPLPTSSSTSSSTSAPSVPLSTHPLEARLIAWRNTQENLKMESLRRTFGMSEPIRRGMELKITREGEWRPNCLKGGNGGSGLGASVSEDILMGTDEGCEWEDCFGGDVEGAFGGGVKGRGLLEEIEGRVGMSG